MVTFLMETWRCCCSGQRYEEGAVEGHREFGTHQQLLAIIRSRKSLRAGAVEEVLGFGHTDKTGSTKSPLFKFVAALNKMELDKKKRFDVRVMELDNIEYVTFKRKRLFDMHGTLAYLSWNPTIVSRYVGKLIWEISIGSDSRHVERQFFFLCGGGAVLSRTGMGGHL